MTRTPPSRRAIAAIARADLADRVRAGVGAALFVQPAVLLLVLVLGVVGPNLVSVNLGKGVRTIAVEHGDRGDGPAARLLTELTSRHPRFVLVPQPDVREAVADSRNTIGLVVRGDDKAELQVVVLPTRRTSTLTAAEVTAALQELELERAGAPAPTITRTKLQHSGEAGRIGLAGLLPFLIAFQLVGLNADASSRIRGGKTDRSAEVFQVLPVHRLDLVLGRAIVGFGEGAARLAAMLLIVAGLQLLPSDVATFSLPAGAIVTLTVAGICQVVVATCGGTLLGARARTESQEAAVQAVLAIGLTGGFLALAFVSFAELPAPVAAIPFVGAVSWARNTFLGSPRPLEAVLVIAVSVVTSIGFVLLAARALDHDGVTLRET